MTSTGGGPRAGPGVRGVVAIALLAVAAGCGTAEADPGTGEAAVIRSVSVVFRSDDDDLITVVAAETDEVLRVLAPGEGGFLRGALRPLIRERHRHGVDEGRPYDLALHADGSLILRDPPTGLELDIDAFGPTSRAEFLTLLPSPPSTPYGPMEDRP